ncbi:pentatricopeptide repeat-containing protein At5g16860-like [Asparagus officinalis]|uniref:pentatricopeptide repeat-containing protein At5g16860-like n=1 Tax=Asparagus officinalis TaxID=4686 RepID=UPI00098E5F38|nr:pentatricopeptide repeat-containing protein At5g16860-like [Asparagus officinalis]
MPSKISANHLQLLESLITHKIPLSLTPKLHSIIITSGLHNDSLLSTKLITLYSQLQNIPSAQKVFTHFQPPNIFILNSMLRALSSNGFNQESINLFSIERKRGLEPDSYTFSCVIKACACISDLWKGKCLHQMAIGCGFGSDVFVCNSLISMYAKCGSLESGVQVFDKMPHRDVVSWNSILSGFSCNGLDLEAMKKAREMVRNGFMPDEATIVSLLKISSIDEDIVREVHCYILRQGHESIKIIKNALISAYGKCDRVNEAGRIFDSLNEKDRVSWNAMISCYAQNGLFDESIDLLRDMQVSGLNVDVVTYSGIISSLSQNNLSNEAMKVFKELLSEGLKPDVIAIASVLPSISGVLCLDFCKQIHAYSYRHGLEFDRRVRNALVSVYCDCGLVQNAERVFKAILDRDVISCSSMVAGYTHNHYFVDAINTYREMIRAEIEPNPITITSVLSACAGISGLCLGKELHSWALKKSLDNHSCAGSALIDMYAKCGRIAYSRRVFDLMKDRNVVTWNSMIGGYAIHGLSENALELFYMLQEPDDVSFIAALSACSHGGLIEDGIKIFNSMKNFKIAPRQAHYTCIVDLLARSGRIQQAVELVRTMPIKASDEIWGVILGASKMHSDTEIGFYSGARILETGTDNSGYYVLLSNMFAGCGKWEEVEGMREMMKEKGVKKGAGSSWIEVDNRFHCFVAKERAQHPEWERMFRVLTFLNEQMR